MRAISASVPYSHSRGCDAKALSSFQKLQLDIFALGSTCYAVAQDDHVFPPSALAFKLSLCLHNGRIDIGPAPGRKRSTCASNSTKSLDGCQRHDDER